MLLKLQTDISCFFISRGGVANVVYNVDGLLLNLDTYENANVSSFAYVETELINSVSSTQSCCVAKRTLLGRR